ncbi:MAG: T9SS type A sorting domain-containing protein [Bacteroidia bacterium]
MKQNLLIFSLLMSFTFNLLNAQNKVNSLGAVASFYVDNACQTGTPIGYIIADGTGGAPPYTFQWSDGSTDAINYNLAGGTYTVTVTDAIAATATVSQTINDIPQGTFNGVYVALPFNSNKNGSFAIAGYPGTETDPPLSFSFYNMTTGSSYGYLNYTDHVGFADSVDAGTWDLNISTGSGCTGEVQIEVGTYPDFIPTVTTADACTGLSNGICLVHANPQGPLPQLSLISSIPTTAFIQLHEQADLTYSILDSATNVILIQHVPTFNNFDIDSTFTGLAAGNYILLMTFTVWSNITFLQDTLYMTTVNFTINSTNNCGNVSGQVFSDANADCIYNAGDLGLPNVLVEFNPGGYLVNTDGSGNFSTDIPYGTYTLTQHSQLYFNQKCPAAGYNFTLSSGTPTVNVPIADSVDFTPDGTIYYGSTPARPGFNFFYSIDAYNMSPNICTPALVTMNFDPSLTYVSSNMAYTSLTSNQIQFNLDTLSAFEYDHISVTFNVPASGVIGDTLFSSVSLSAATGEANLTNNSTGSYIIVTGSYDPNEKSVLPEGALKPNVDLNYTIRFQNTGNDTAFTVTVIDTISSYLDITSVLPGASSHPYSYDFPSPNVIRFKFDNILLVDSNHNELLSHGFINYSIRQQQNNPVGTVIENTAGIYFDFNAPVLTNTTQNTVQTVFVGLNDGNIIPFKIYPNPLKDILQIQFTEKMNHFKIEFTNALGEIVLKASLPGINAGSTLNSNLSRLPDGVYMLKVSDEKNIFTQRIVKQ